MLQLNKIIADHHLTAECIIDLEAVIKSIEFERGEYLVKAGNICDRLYYIEKGLVQCYKGVKSTKQTLWFMLESEIALFKSSFYNQTESEANIVAMEDTRAYSISHTDLRRLCRTHHSFALMVLKMTEGYHTLSDLKSDVLESRDPEERYNHLKRLRPDIVARVPQKDLASFLRITRETLSRIKKNKKTPPAPASDK